MAKVSPPVQSMEAKAFFTKMNDTEALTVLFGAKRQSEGDLQNCQHQHVVYMHIHIPSLMINYLKDMHPTTVMLHN